MSKISFILFHALVICFSLHAQQDSLQKDMEEVIITANRFPQKQNTTGKVVTVINRNEIEKNAGRTLGELLIQQAGITIIGANNTLGTNQDIYMRGSATGNVLVLIDGVPAYDPSNITSTFDINHLALDQYERIEILKGAQSTVYGSDAVAGVINLITKKHSNKPLDANILLSAGSYHTNKIAAGLNGRKEKSSYQVQYQFLKSGGISSAIDTTGKNNYENDDFNQNIISGNYQYRITDNLEWVLSGQYGRYKYGLDASAFTDDRDFRGENKNLQLGTGLKYKYKNGNIQANFNSNNSKRSYTDDSVFVGGFSKFSMQDYTGETGFAEIFAHHRFSEKLNLVFGTDYRWQKTDQRFLSISDFGPYETNLSPDSAKARIISVYASTFIQLGKLFNLEGGGRFNNHSRFGSNATFTLNPSVKWNRFRFFANLSSAFKAPSLYQLYDAAAGNRTLKPERSITTEAGLQYITTNKKWNSRLVFFQRNIRDGIEYSYVDYKYFNNNVQNDYGFELESNIREKKWNAGFNYTFLKGKVNTVKYIYDAANFVYIPMGDTTFNNLFRRPQHQFNVSVGYQVTSTIYLSANARITGKRLEPRFMESPITLSAYKTFDIYAEYRISKKITTFANVNNLLNEKYMDISGYAPRGRNFMIGGRLALSIVRD
jgi:vitamin B12 transporter